jgi:putative addiction module component (TIGR02574 family)
MSDRTKDLLKEALQLSIDERAELASEIIESLDAEEDVEAEEEWRREVGRRVAEIDSGKATLVSEEEARERIFRRGNESLDSRVPGPGSR